MKTVVSIIDYFDYPARSGDIIAACNELNQLKNSGYKVIDFHEYISNSKKESVNNFKKNTVSEFASLYHSNIDFVISNQPSNYDIGLVLSKLTGARLVIRQHLDYESLIRAVRNISTSVNSVITRQPYMETIANFKKSKYSQHLVVSTDANTIHKKSDNLCFCPPPIHPEILTSSCSYKDKTGNLRIAISGRLNDPVKGGERIYKTLKTLNFWTNKFSVSVFGDISISFFNKMYDLLGSRFNYYSWIDSRNTYLNLLSSNDVFLALPYYEAYGLALQESILLGLMPISTKQGLAYILSKNMRKSPASKQLLTDCFIDNIYDDEWVSLQATSVIKKIISNRKIPSDQIQLLQLEVNRINSDYDGLPKILDNF